MFSESANAPVAGSASRRAMAVEASKRSTRIPGIAESPSQPARNEALLLENDWPQFMAKPQHGRRAPALYASSIYANQGILSCRGHKRRAGGGEFRHLSPCSHGLLSISRHSRINDGARHFVKIRHSNCVSAP